MGLYSGASYKVVKSLSLLYVHAPLLDHCLRVIVSTPLVGARGAGSGAPSRGSATIYTYYTQNKDSYGQSPPHTKITFTTYPSHHRATCNIQHGALRIVSDSQPQRQQLILSSYFQPVIINQSLSIAHHYCQSHSQEVQKLIASDRQIAFLEPSSLPFIAYHCQPVLANQSQKEGRSLQIE